MKKINYLCIVILIIFFLVLINFIDNTKETFQESSSIQSNIIILNRKLHNANSKETNQNKMFEPLTNFTF
jgi:hypothetical protein